MRAEASVCVRLIVRVAGSNIAEGINGNMLCFLCVVYLVVLYVWCFVCTGTLCLVCCVGIGVLCLVCIVYVLVRCVWCVLCR
jgi:hypothetical protein